MKSIGQSLTLAEDVSDIEKAKIVLMQLADEVGMTARKYEKKGRTVQITLNIQISRLLHDNKLYHLPI